MSPGGKNQNPDQDCHHCALLSTAVIFFVDDCALLITAVIFFVDNRRPLPEYFHAAYASFVGYCSSVSITDN